jgi:hypothetical protein
MSKKVRPKRPEPPAGRPSPPELFPVPKFGQVVVRLLSEALTMNQHPGKDRPIACPGEERCPKALHAGATRFKAYAACERWRPEPIGDWLPCVLEITEALWRIMRKHELRGTYWSLWRLKSEGAPKEVTGDLVDEVDADTLRKDVDIYVVVHRVYGTNDIHWGVEPLLDPIPPLPPSTDGPPASLRGKKVQKEKLEASERRASSPADLERLRKAKEQLAGQMNGQSH